MIQTRPTPFMTGPVWTTYPYSSGYFQRRVQPWPTLLAYSWQRPTSFSPRWSFQQPAFPAFLPLGTVQGVRAVQAVAQAKPSVWHNELKTLLHERCAVIYALNIRTFGADDKNHDGRIDPYAGENGTFLKAIPRLKALKNLGVNVIHLLPINPVGKIDKLGTFDSPGSLYAPAAYDKLNPEFDEPGNTTSVVEEAKQFVAEAHRLGIHVMVDIPSCASKDLAQTRPDLLARDIHGNALTPTNWVDIRMLVKDSPALREYYQKFFDLMVNDVGVDGFRADVARARSLGFWRHFIDKYPKIGWLAESYTKEDASPMNNIPRDVPEELLQAGFDTIYGQFHIFHEMDSRNYTDYLAEQEAMLARIGVKKSLLGSFLTHDDSSLMAHGGALYTKMALGLMMTQPHTNPYFVDGELTGDPEQLDIFNWKPRPGGKHPDIEAFAKELLILRQSATYQPVLTTGAYMPLRIDQQAHDPKIIAFLRQVEDKTLLVVANKDVNRVCSGTIHIPGFSPEVTLNNNLKSLVSSITSPSEFHSHRGSLGVELMPGSFYVFQIDAAPLSAMVIPPQAKPKEEPKQNQPLFPFSPYTPYRYVQPIHGYYPPSNAQSYSAISRYWHA